MSNASDPTRGLASLRQRAAEKLQVSRPAAGNGASQTQALAVLHQLALSPTTAGDAVALLHELQVHQVELELQQEELRRTQAELEAALSRQTALVERAPVAYMTIDAHTVLCEINLAGARLLGAPREELLGRPLAALLTAPSADALHQLLGHTREGSAPQACALQLKSVAGVAGTMQAAADQDTTPGRYLLVLTSPAVQPSRPPGA